MADYNHPQPVPISVPLLQSPTAGAHNHWEAEVQIQALLAVQQLELQRLHLRPHGARHQWTEVE